MEATRCPAGNQLMEYKNNLKSSPGIITVSSGNPVGIEDASQTVGPRGPMLMQDSHFIDVMSHFDCERIPERVVNAKGCGAFGYFEVTNNITDFCAAKVFEKVKKRTPVGVRFSTMTGEVGSADTVRDARGFAIKFYTEDGIWDLVASNIPIFLIRDPNMFPSLIHAMKRNPQTHLKDPEMFWDFMTLRPETTHYLLFLFSDRGIPYSYRFMHGYSVHAYKLVNNRGEPIFAKFHLKSDQGIKNLESNQALQEVATSRDHCVADLFNTIKGGNYPSWTMYMQVMTFDQAKRFPFNPFDATKIWSQQDYPLMRVGKLVLDRNPVNYFAEIEEIAFSPANMVPGIEPSPDKLLQGRLFAYADTQRHRLGANFLQIPVNCPYKVNISNYQRDGPACVTSNQGGAPNYYPNSYSGPEIDSRAKCLTTCCPVSGDVYRFSSGDTEDNYDQATTFYMNVLDEFEKKRLAINLANHLSLATQPIQERAVKIFSLVHSNLGSMLTEELNMIKNEKSNQRKSI